MFELKPPPKEQRSTDWSGTILAVVLSPVFFIFASMGKEDFGFTAYFLLGVFIFAVLTRWKLRRHAWFWATVVLLLVLHVPLLFMLQWPHGQVPAIVYTIPVGIADFLLVIGALRLAAALFANDVSAEGEDA